MSNISKILKKDGLREAEKITGKSYKEDAVTEFIGISKHLKNVKDRKETLETLGDTTFNSNLEDYLAIVKDIGFKVVHKDSFIKDDCKRHQYIMWHDSGMLLNFDTFNFTTIPEETINSASLYLNFKSSKDVCFYSKYGFSFSVSYNDNNVQYIDCDAREALRHKVDAFLSNGEVLKQWQGTMCFSLCNHGERENKIGDYGTWIKKLNKEKISKFPKNVQKSILSGLVK